MRTIQFREAVCETMNEEMRRDESIYLMGEKVAKYNGAYKTVGWRARAGARAREWRGQIRPGGETGCPAQSADRWFRGLSARLR